MITEKPLDIEILIEDIYQQSGRNYPIDYNDIATFKRKYRPIMAITERNSPEQVIDMIQKTYAPLTNDADYYILAIKVNQGMSKDIASSLLESLLSIVGRNGIWRVMASEELDTDEVEVGYIPAKIRSSGECTREEKVDKALLAYRIEKDYYGAPMCDEPLYIETAIDAYEKRILTEIRAGKINDAYYSGMKMLWYIPSAEEAPTDIDWNRLEKLVNLIVSTGRFHNVIPPYPPLNNVDRIDLEYDLYSITAGVMAHERLSGIHQYMIRLTSSLVPLDRNIKDNWDHWEKLMKMYRLIHASPELADDLFRMLKMISAKIKGTGNQKITLQEAAVRICRMRERGDRLVLFQLFRLAELYEKEGIWLRPMEIYKEMLRSPHCSDLFPDVIESRIKDLEKSIKKTAHE